MDAQAGSKLDMGRTNGGRTEKGRGNIEVKKKNSRKQNEDVMLM